MKIGHFTMLMMIMVIFMSAQSCSRSTKSADYYELSIAEMASLYRNETKLFCVVLIDSTDVTSAQYICQRNRFGNKNAVIFDFLNKSGPVGQQLDKLILPKTYPVTCVFSVNMELIDMIPGYSAESFAYIDKVVNEGQMAEEFHYNGMYEGTKRKYIEALNKAFAVASGSLRINSRDDELENVFLVTKNPYVWYLQSDRLLSIGDTIEAKTAANRFLACDSILCFYKFPDEILAMSCLLDPSYNRVTAPVISSTQQYIDMPNCLLNNSYEIAIPLLNLGEKTLKIAAVYPSCSCIEIQGFPQSIEPHCGGNVIVTFTPDIDGEVVREIGIVSNSIDEPIYVITIEANVKS